MVALVLPHPNLAGPGLPAAALEIAAGPGAIRVLVHARNRQRALTRIRNLGFRAVRLAGNTDPPTPDEVSAVLYHPDGFVWRPHPAAPGPAACAWRPTATLPRV